MTTRTLLSATFAVVCFAMLSLNGGCQVIADPKPEMLDDSPLVIDEAMERREDWAKSAVVYPNGSTLAWPMIYRRESTLGMDPNYEWLAPFWEPTLMFGQTLYMPVSVFEEQPWTARVYRGATIEPTYTATPMWPVGEKAR